MRPSLLQQKRSRKPTILRRPPLITQEETTRQLGNLHISRVNSRKHEANFRFGAGKYSTNGRVRVDPIKGINFRTRRGIEIEEGSRIMNMTARSKIVFEAKQAMIRKKQTKSILGRVRSLIYQIVGMFKLG